MNKILIILGLSGLISMPIYAANPGLSATKSEDASIKIPFTGNIKQADIEAMIKSLLGLTDSDTKKVEDKVTAWAKELDFESEALPEKIEAYINARVKDATNQLTEKVKAVNTEIDKQVATAAKTIKSSLDGVAPKMKISGDYSYCDGDRDPGDPGWSLNSGMSILDQPKALTGNFDVSFSQEINVTATAEAGVILASATVGIELPITVGVIISGSATGSLTARDQTAPNPLNKPTAEVGAVPYLTLTVSGKAGVQSIISVTVGGAIVQDYELTKEPVKADIVAGKHLTAAVQ